MSLYTIGQHGRMTRIAGDAFLADGVELRADPNTILRFRSGITLRFLKDAKYCLGCGEEPQCGFKQATVTFFPGEWMVLKSKMRATVCEGGDVSISERKSMYRSEADCAPQSIAPHNCNAPAAQPDSPQPGRSQCSQPQCNYPSASTCNYPLHSVAVEDRYHLTHHGAGKSWAQLFCECGPGLLNGLGILLIALILLSHFVNKDSTEAKPPSKSESANQSGVLVGVYNQLPEMACRLPLGACDPLSTSNKFGFVGGANGVSADYAQKLLTDHISRNQQLVERQIAFHELTWPCPIHPGGAEWVPSLMPPKAPADPLPAPEKSAPKTKPERGNK